MAPKVFGVEMAPCGAAGRPLVRWTLLLGDEAVEFHGTPEFGASVYYMDTSLLTVPCGSTFESASALIDARLTEIESAIRAAREGKK